MITRLEMMGGGFALVVAALNGAKVPLEDAKDRRRADSGVVSLKDQSPQEFPILLLELCGKYPGGEEAGIVTHRDSRRIVTIDLEDEDDWGDVNWFWTGTEMAWGLGDDVNGYWKIERVFEMVEPRVELHEDKFPISYELTLEQFRVLMEKRVESWV